MIGTDVSVAADLLTHGKLVAIPTETVYGLAANAFSSSSVLQIFKAKNRPSFDPLIVHISDLSWVDKLTLQFPEKAKRLADKFWPGPLTLILPKSKLVPDVVTSGLPFVGIRMPRHPMTIDLLQHLDFPLAAPSANPFSYVSPTTAQHVSNQLGDRIDYILDGGPCIVGLESTIISFENADHPTVLRFGGLSLEEIEDVVGGLKVSDSNNSNPMAPGQLDKHYATKKPIKLVDDVAELLQFDKDEYFVIGFGEPASHLSYNLSPTSNLDEIASNLFTSLRLADEASQSLNVASKVPDTGLGRAINDRLERAQVK